MEKSVKKSDEFISVTARLGAEFVKEVDEIAEALFSNRTSILQECLKLGLESFKSKRPEIMKVVKSNRRGEK